MTVITNPVIGEHIPWKFIKKIHFRIKHVTNLAQVTSKGEVKATNPTMPYALLKVEDGTHLIEFQLRVTHRLDFLNLWAIYNDRGIKPEEEVLVAYTPQEGLLGFFFSSIQPCLSFYIYPAGHLKNKVDPAQPGAAHLPPLGMAYGRHMRLGIGAADLADYAIIGASKIANGANSFAAWSQSMLAEFGESIRPQLVQVFDQSLKLHNELEKTFHTPFRDEKQTIPATNPGQDLAQVRLAVHSATEKGKDFYLQNQFSDALEAFDEVLRNYGVLDSTQMAEIYTLRGSCLQSLGWHLDAIEDFGKAIELNASEPDNFFMRGVSHQSIGELSEAVHDFERFIALAPKTNDFEVTLLQSRSRIVMMQRELGSPALLELAGRAKVKAVERGRRVRLHP
jgi:tetratricopeptide (TPR) repeat protein